MRGERGRNGAPLNFALVGQLLNLVLLIIRVTCAGIHHSSSDIASCMT
jgi:hypothetical protein